MRKLAKLRSGLFVICVVPDTILMDFGTLNQTLPCDLRNGPCRYTLATKDRSISKAPSAFPRSGIS